jgi:uncharacterized membrane protein YwaF
MPIDVGLGANYGFLGNPADPSEVPPFIDALGPWPLRAIIVIALAPLGFVIVLLPWLFWSKTARLNPAACEAAGRPESEPR